MNTVETAVTSHPFLKTLQPEHLELVTRNAKEVEYQEDELLFKTGELANRMFLIQSGRVAVEHRNAKRDLRVQTLRNGEVVGWSWLFPPFVWHFQARAVE